MKPSDKDKKNSIKLFEEHRVERHGIVKKKSGTSPLLI